MIGFLKKTSFLLYLIQICKHEGSTEWIFGKFCGRSDLSYLISLNSVSAFFFLPLGQKVKKGHWVLILKQWEIFLFVSIYLVVYGVGFSLSIQIPLNCYCWFKEIIILFWFCFNALHLFMWNVISFVEKFYKIPFWLNRKEASNKTKSKSYCNWVATFLILMGKVWVWDHLSFCRLDWRWNKGGKKKENMQQSFFC